MTARQGTTAIAAVGTPEEVERLRRLARELRLTDQILTWDVDSVDVMEVGPAPAWTSLDGTKITFSARRMPKPEGPYEIAVWLGVNAHELGHVLFSPRESSPLVGRLMTKGIEQFWRMHNVVEDQRQERLLLGRFSAWSGYLIAALAHHIPPDADGAWLLLAGRTWVPAADRDAAYDEFAVATSGEMADRVRTLVGDYQRLTDPGESQVNEAWSIIEELVMIAGSLAPATTCKPIAGGDPEGDSATGNPDLPPAADEDEPDEGEDEDGEGEQSGKGDDDDADDGDAEDGESEGDSSKDGEKGDGQPEPAPKDGKGEQGQGAGTESGEPEKSLKDALKDAAKEALKGDAAKDLERVVDAVDSVSDPGDSEAPRHDGSYEPATATAQQLEREISDALLDLKDDCEAGWVKRTDSGRLNVRRWKTDPSADYDELFDRFDPGALDAADMEVVLLVDTSGSMSGSARPLGEAVWAIRQAVDRLEGEVSVFTYDTDVRVLAQGSERVDRRQFMPWTGGGTNPASALDEAYRIVANSQARNRLVLMLTDGQWSGGGEKLRAINATGAVTALALMGPWAEPWECQYGQQITVQVKGPKEFALLFKQVAAWMIEAAR
jgi:hypothetical protein